MYAKYAKIFDNLKSNVIIILAQTPEIEQGLGRFSKLWSA